MVNVGYDNRLSEHLGVEQLGLLPLYKGTFEHVVSCHVPFWFSMYSIVCVSTAVVILSYTVLTLLWILECYLRRRNVAVRTPLTVALA
jgi:hypothetical protein